jgi:hypothetical protein
MTVEIDQALAAEESLMGAPCHLINHSKVSGGGHELLTIIYRVLSSDRPHIRWAVFVDDSEYAFYSGILR